jgi:hypothetical protein
MVEQTIEVISGHFRSRRAGESSTNQTYLALWVAYQRGALSADEFMRDLEREFLRGMEKLEARWTAVKW